MLNFENMSRPEMIAARRTIRDNLDTLTAIYKDTCTGNPADTVKALAVLHPGRFWTFAGGVRFST